MKRQDLKRPDLKRDLKRQAARDSPSRAGAKRLRERDRDRDREGGRRDELPPLALLLAERHHRDKPRSHELLLGRPPPELPARAPLLPPRAPEAPRAPALEYKTLLISGLGAQVPDEDVEDTLFHEFKKFGDVSVKLSHTPELGRIAYVNFRHPEDAKEARHARSSRLMLGDRQLKIEPMYVRKRSVTPPDVGFPPLHGPYTYRQRSLSPPGPGGSSIRDLRDLRARHYALETLGLSRDTLGLSRDTLGLSRDRDRLLDYYGMLDERGRPYGFPPVPVVEDLKPEDDQRATSNLFIGNLDGNVTEAELRRGFDKYGIIEDVVIKRPARGQGGAYAFVKFQNLDMAHRAKVAMQGRLIGGNPIKIGYGKANPTTRLWVGGLGPGNSLAALAREFDRFGSIRNIDYVKGDSFAYIQYESLDAAQAACTQMRGFPLGGPERRLRVDFAKVEESPSRPFPAGYQPAVALPAHYDLLGDAYSRHRSLERELRGARERSSPPPHTLLTPRERDRALLDRDFPGSPTRSLERRAEAFGRRRSRSRSRERWLKEREERRSRRRSRSVSPDRPAEERDRDKDRGRSRLRAPGGLLSPDASPDRARVRAPDSTTEPRDHSPDSARAGHSLLGDEDPPSGRHHGKRSLSDLSNHHHRSEPASSPARHTQATPTSLSDFAQASLARLWHGFFALKNSSFPTHLYLLEGGASFFNAAMKDTLKNAPAQLKIAQRLRMDQTRLDEVSRRIKLGRPDGFAVLLALQGPLDRAAPAPEPGLQVRLLRHLVTYLRNKEAAGVVSLPGEGGGGAMLYAFPPGDFSQQFLTAAKRTVGGAEEEHMVVVIVSDNN